MSWAELRWAKQQSDQFYFSTFHENNRKIIEIGWKWNINLKCIFWTQTNIAFRMMSLSLSHNFFRNFIECIKNWSCCFWVIGEMIKMHTIRCTPFENFKFGFFCFDQIYDNTLLIRFDINWPHKKMFFSTWECSNNSKCLVFL